MKVTYMGVLREADKWSYNGILTSVRWAGTGANVKQQMKEQQKITWAWDGCYCFNNPNLKLEREWDKLQVNMGAAHKNQYYRPVHTKDGISRHRRRSAAIALEEDGDVNGIFNL